MTASKIFAKLMSEKISKGVLYGMLLNVNVAEAVADVNSSF